MTFKNSWQEYIIQLKKCQDNVVYRLVFIWDGPNAKWDSGLRQNVILKGRYREKSLSERSFLIYNIFSLGKLCCLKLCAAKRSLIMAKFRSEWRIRTVRGPLDSKNSGELSENCNISSTNKDGEVIRRWTLKIKDSSIWWRGTTFSQRDICFNLIKLLLLKI